MTKDQNFHLIGEKRPFLLSTATWYYLVVVEPWSLPVSFAAAQAEVTPRSPSPREDVERGVTSAAKETRSMQGVLRQQT